MKEERRARLDDYVRHVRHAVAVSGRTVWEVPCDLALPCATQNEIGGAEAAALVAGGCVAVVEGANMPTTPEAVRILGRAGVRFAPGKAANAGGVAVSALEMQQNASRDSWTFAQSEQRLRETMRDIHARCWATAEEYGLPGDYVAGRTSTGSGGSRRRCWRTVWCERSLWADRADLTDRSVSQRLTGFEAELRFRALPAGRHPSRLAAPVPGRYPSPGEHRC
ncbi:hypothetical protein [Micromonospora fulviviridis]|uniref:hypothetical protein n=1 Tax=Micromonospora fulviviridis TaxID=47860 RepID=UPI0037893B9F